MKSKTRIITHRGLDYDIDNFHKENTLQAFMDQLERGYGLEFDVRFTKDGALVVIHDADLKRMTGGTDLRKISDISFTELTHMDFGGDTLTGFDHLLSLIQTKSAPGAISAVHFKSAVQTPERIDQILASLKKIDPSLFMAFDLTRESATHIHHKNPHLQLAASVSHPYDIERFNSVVGGTLMTLDDIIAHKNLFTWAWLDEWDRADKNGGTKTLLNEETFSRLRKAGIKIALVTPEMHATSPGLLGGEAHPDATNEARLKEILALEPDAVCTDRPDYVRTLLDQ